MGDPEALLEQRSHLLQEALGRRLIVSNELDGRVEAEKLEPMVLEVERGLLQPCIANDNILNIA